jgi:hypothetical protein
VFLGLADQVSVLCLDLRLTHIKVLDLHRVAVCTGKVASGDGCGLLRRPPWPSATGPAEFIVAIAEDGDGDRVVSLFHGILLL